VVGDPSGVEPQAGDVSLSALRRAPPLALGAHAARPRGRHEPASPRAFRLRPRRPRGRTAADQRRVARDAAAPALPSRPPPPARL